MEALKSENTKHLAALGIEVPDHLPLIEDIEHVRPRSAKDVASRLSAITYIIGLGFGADSEELLDHLARYNLLSYVSNYEKRLLNSETIQEQDKINITWLSEGAQSLAWCIGLVDLDHFRQCDENLAESIPFQVDPSDFISNSTLRPIGEIQRQVDLLYRMHWYVRNCRLIGINSQLNESIISERRKAMDWVYGVEEDWDEIPMDT